MIVQFFEIGIRNLQEQVKKAFCYQKLLWPFTVWINCSRDLKIFANSRLNANSRPSASNFKSFSRSLEQYFLTVRQNNFGNKIPFLRIIRIKDIRRYLLKSFHFKNTVAQSSFLSKLWSFSHQLISKQSQLMFYWKWPQFWKKWGSRNCDLKVNELYVLPTKTKVSNNKAESIAHCTVQE